MTELTKLTKQDYENLQSLIRRATIQGGEAETVTVLLLKLRHLASQPEQAITAGKPTEGEPEAPKGD
jgi:hypothetical protein